MLCLIIVPIRIVHDLTTGRLRAIIIYLLAKRDIRVRLDHSSGNKIERDNLDKFLIIKVHEK